jgi:hypothetical protein
MANETRGIRGIRTLAKLIDGRRARTPAGALLELSAMANEKQLLNREIERWARRHVEIEARLNEMAAKERRLMALVTGSGAVADSPAADPASKAATPVPAPAIDRKFRVQEISY